MALTPSTMLPLGTPAPAFSLEDTDGHQVVLDTEKKAPAFLVMFICNHCPYVKHIREGLAALGNEYQEKGVAVYAISANNPESHPDDAPDKMRLEKQVAGYRFPYLFDKTQETAKNYHAACTPDFYVFDGAQKLAYRGQMDDSRPGNDIPVTGKDLRAALEQVLGGQPASPQQKPSMGCNIKWIPGNEPEYFKF